MVDLVLFINCYHSASSIHALVLDAHSVIPLVQLPEPDSVTTER